jgi:hypothetical protein
VPEDGSYVKSSAETKAKRRPFEVLTVTVTGTVPLPAGLVATILLLRSSLTPAAAVPPKRTVVADVKQRPVMVTAVPPAAGPVAGEIAVIRGCGKLPHDGPGSGLIAAAWWQPETRTVRATITAAVTSRDRADLASRAKFRCIASTRLT